MATTMEPMNLAMNATAISTSTAAPDRPMSFNADCAALPECFTTTK